MADEEETVEMSDEEKSFLHNLNSPFITEVHQVIEENKEAFVTSILAIVVGVLVIVSLGIWLCIKI